MLNPHERTTNQMHFRPFATSALLASTLLVPALLSAQQQPGQIAPASADSQTAGPQTWTMDQLVTSTVHQAWLLSGKNEATFFEMVQQLAALSAKNRDITLPDSAAAGRRMGSTIKRLAKADTDQLLYAVVDKAVLATSTSSIHKAGQPHQ